MTVSIPRNEATGPETGRPGRGSAPAWPAARARSPRSKLWRPARACPIGFISQGRAGSVVAVPSGPGAARRHAADRDRRPSSSPGPDAPDPDPIVVLPEGPAGTSASGGPASPSSFLTPARRTQGMSLFPHGAEGRGEHRRRAVSVTTGRRPASSLAGRAHPDRRVRARFSSRRATASRFERPAAAPLQQSRPAGSQTIVLMGQRPRIATSELSPTQPCQFAQPHARERGAEKLQQWRAGDVAVRGDREIHNRRMRRPAGTARSATRKASTYRL